MEAPQIRKHILGTGLPSFNPPFAALLDTDEGPWDDSAFVWKSAKELLQEGCTYFVCSGRRAELVHDHVDDLILEGEYQNITTTFHDSKDEALFFLRKVASAGMRELWLLALDPSSWEP